MQPIHESLMSSHVLALTKTAFRYPVGDCENRGAHSHNRQDELSLGFGRNQYGFWLWGFNKSCLGW